MSFQLTALGTWNRRYCAPGENKDALTLNMQQDALKDALTLKDAHLATGCSHSKHALSSCLIFMCKARGGARGGGEGNSVAPIHWAGHCTSQHSLYPIASLEATAMPTTEQIKGKPANTMMHANTISPSVVVI